MSILKKLFGIGGGVGDSKAPAAAAEIEHEGYRVTAAPISEGGQFRVAGSIEREIDGETKRHDFIRADVLPGKDAAVDLTLLKAKQIIKEQGDRMFA